MFQRLDLLPRQDVRQIGVQFGQRHFEFVGGGDARRQRHLAQRADGLEHIAPQPPARVGVFHQVEEFGRERRLFRHHGMNQKLRLRSEVEINRALGDPGGRATSSIAVLRYPSCKNNSVAAATIRRRLRAFGSTSVSEDWNCAISAWDFSRDHVMTDQIGIFGHFDKTGAFLWPEPPRRRRWISSRIPRVGSETVSRACRAAPRGPCPVAGTAGSHRRRRRPGRRHRFPKDPPSGRKPSGRRRWRIPSPL